VLIFRPGYNRAFHTLSGWRLDRTKLSALLKYGFPNGVQFFLDHITGPEDLLFILIHERNHLILRRLYPDVLPGDNYPREVFNFAEDAYVNAIGRRQVASTLPERFYHQPELLLTAKHSCID
jgi:hypothetical protein